MFVVPDVRQPLRADSRQVPGQNATNCVVFLIFSMSISSLLFLFIFVHSLDKKEKTKGAAVITVDGQVKYTRGVPHLQFELYQFVFR